MHLFLDLNNFDDNNLDLSTDSILMFNTERFNGKKCSNLLKFKMKPKFIIKVTWQGNSTLKYIKNNKGILN